MMLRPPQRPPVGHDWRASWIPKPCPNPCASPARPTQFIVIWRMISFLYIPVSGFVDPRGYIHVLTGYENYWFMSSAGCLTVPPPGYPINPFTNRDVRAKLPSSFDPQLYASWGVIGGELRGAGALDPGTIVTLHEIRDAIREAMDLNRP